MFNAEEGAPEIIEAAISKYEKHFKQVFPLYEYVGKTKSKDYDFSLAGAERLSKFIAQKIENDEFVEVPKGYEERVY